MAQIHILDSETIDKIAAGEVVERPSSVVKELVENAIDAGATAITVEVRDGGIEFIRVTDNGCGMDREQLRTAFLRHATSKIENAMDLMKIHSLGFRGEALSSIAAVSRTEVITRTRESMTGSRILMEGAKELAFDEVGAPEGTTFLMRNLFFNTPVRRKFLKQPATEGGYIADLMEHLALSRPDISFKLVLGKQLRFHTSGNGDLKEVIYRIYGREVAGALVPISVRENGVQVEGYLGKPVQVRSNRNFEIYFINGRFIKSNVVARALEEGYKEYLMQHKFPLCVLHITMDTSTVDVNVHPTKMDVRFSNSLWFAEFLMKSVRSTLQQREMIPEALLSDSREQKRNLAEEKRELEKQKTPEPFELNRRDAYRVMEEAKLGTDYRDRSSFAGAPGWKRENREDRENRGERSEWEGRGEREDREKWENREERKRPEEETEEFFTETSEIQEEMSPAVNPDADVNAGPSESPKAAETVSTESSENLTSAETVSTEPSESPKAAGTVSTEPSGNPNPAVREEQALQLNLFEEKILTREHRRQFRILGQAFETYWLVEYGDKLLMIDQHAAHEKVNYERLIKRYRERAVSSQRLMPPIIVSLSGQEEAVLRENQEVFEGLGFEVEAFGGSEYALRSVPTELFGCNEREMFLEVLDQLAAGVSFGGIQVIEEKIASMSCKAAVKGNNRLSVQEAEALIDELLTLNNPYNCPHGRPTIVTMTKTEMDRKFKRIVT